MVTAIIRKEAKSLHWQERYAAHDAERDDDADECADRAIEPGSTTSCASDTKPPHLVTVDLSVERTTSCKLGAKT